MAEAVEMAAAVAASAEASGAAAGGKATIDASGKEFKELNQEIRSVLKDVDEVELTGVLAQRYIGCAIPAGKRIVIDGVPGNDMACYMDGAHIEVCGNAQDQVGNTMNDGTVVIHGRCGDAAGYAMRGGKIFVREDVGWRVGIIMKEYQDRVPTIVIGGNAGGFLGEYMAGGIIVLMGEAGDYMATGMCGGVIFLRNKIADEAVLEGLVLEPVDAVDLEVLNPLIDEYHRHFAGKAPEGLPTTGEGFWKLRPASSRPYASMYAH